ncbi:MAG: SMP-30/gluconolactonase/LRE family protein [Pyrinomonadaceae bacterium]
MSRASRIKSLSPTSGIPGGEVIVEYKQISGDVLNSLEVRFDGASAHLIAANRTRAIAIIPETATDGAVRVDVANDRAVESSERGVDFMIARQLAANLHPVTNPAFNPADGALFVTRSGSRGEHVPVSLYRIDREGTIEDFSGDIMNPTSIAFDRTGRMFVTSRFDGTVYRVTGDRELIAFVSDLGVATGLAFNREGQMFVGDRSGTIYRVNEIGEAKPWAQHEPSVSAYHLAFGPDDQLYVTGPTVSSFDSIIRFDEGGNPREFFRGLGRPQGLALDAAGNVYVAAALRGRRGIVRISHDANQAELIVAGMNLVGVAFGPQGDLIVASNEAVFSLPLGIPGALLT